MEQGLTSARYNVDGFLHYNVTSFDVSPPLVDRLVMVSPGGLLPAFRQENHTEASVM